MESNEHKPNITPVGKGTVRLGVFAAAAILTILFIVGYLPKRNNKQRLEAQEVRDVVPSVNTIMPHLAPDTGVLLPGNIEAIEEARVGARASGYVRQRYVDIGYRVKAGQVLAEIESPDVDQQLAQAQSDVDRSRATVGQSQADVARLQAGVSQAQADVARQRSGIKQASAQLASTEAKLAQARAAQATTEAKLQQSRHALEVQKANLVQGQANLEQARSTAKRYDTLLKQGFIALQDAEEKDTAVRTSAATVEALRSGVQASEADVQAALQEVEASKAVVTSGESDVAAARENVSSAEAVLNSVQANVRAVQAGVRSGQATVTANRAAVNSNQAATRRVAVLRSFEKVVAPFDGVVTARFVDTGALVKADADTTGATGGLFNIARTDVLRIKVNVPQSMVNTIQPGLPAQVLVREYPGRTFEGKVFQSSGAFDSGTRTLLTEVHIPNPGNVLRPGMFVQVQMSPPKEHTSLRISSDTLVVNASGTRVVSVGADRKLHFIPITIGRDFGKEVEVTQGLRGDEQLVLNPTNDLTDGERVEAIPAATTTAAK